MNRLKHETSPYLLQHAENPVDWHPWGPEALQRAREEDKPILVSIGYSTCHWCHVMERESFENEEVAEFMNAHFVNIKVDREERPDIDQLYMEAVQIITGSGGWPLNCFLTPDGRPFYGGTYYPPQPMHRRPSWMQLLRHLRQTFRNKRDTVEKQADQLTELLGRSERRLFETAASMVLEAPKGEGPDEELLAHFFRRLRDDFDTEEGGLGGAPKFPSTMALNFLLHYYHYSRDSEALEHVQLSLRKMIYGGIYDQLGGGFARYTVDKAWLVPHFEKMLYDNALLVSLMADVFRYTGEEELRQTVTETLGFVNRELSHPEGGFYSALDADSEGEEGKFYVWSKAEVDEVLGPERSRIFCAYYDVTEGGNWEGKNILHRHLPMSTFAERLNKPVAELQEELAEARRLLFERRSRRVRPGLDDKVLLNWNALMVVGFLRAARATGEEAWGERALQALRFFEENMRQAEREGYFHSYKDGQARQPAFLDDYAYLIRAWIEAYQYTHDAVWLDKAGEAADWVIEQFWDKREGLFFYTTSEQKDILLRKKELFDNATPSGNAVMAQNLLQLSVLLDRSAYSRRAEEMYDLLMNALKRFPSSFCEWLTGATMSAHGFYELAISGPDYRSRAAEVQRLPLLNTLTAAAPQAVEEAPLLRGKEPIEGETAIYLCKNYSCRRPVTTIEALRQ